MSKQQHKSKTESEQDIEKEEQPTIELESVVLNRDEIIDAANKISDSAEVTNFTATRSGINHGHSIDKHDVREAYDVRDEFVSKIFSKFGVLPNDHAALWLLSLRKEEFIQADEDIFQDKEDTDENVWDEIESAKTLAPIDPETKKNLRLRTH